MSWLNWLLYEKAKNRKILKARIWYLCLRIIFCYDFIVRGTKINWNLELKFDKNINIKNTIVIRNYELRYGVKCLRKLNRLGLYIERRKTSLSKCFKDLNMAAILLNWTRGSWILQLLRQGWLDSFVILICSWLKIRAI